MHGGGGNVLGFREISQRLGKDYPFYGLQARGVDGVLAPLTDIGDMARLYIEAVKTVDHSGPYCLAGYSGGGVVAFEMAQQLRQQGFEVPLLVMFDTLSPVASIKEMRLKDKLKAARNLDVRYVLDWPALKRRRRQKHNYLKELEEKLLPGEPVPHELLETTLMDAYLTAQSRYEPRAYTGSLLLFRASRADLRYTWAGASLGWAAFAQNLEIKTIAASHDSMMLEPAIVEVAGILRRRIDAAGTSSVSKPAAAPALRLVDAATAA